MTEAVGVPRAAVNAAVAALLDLSEGSGEDLARAALTAAAPFIAAAALRQVAEELWDRMDGSLMCQTYCAWLRFRADQMDGRQPVPDTREGILAAAGLTEEDMQGRSGG